MTSNNRFSSLTCLFGLAVTVSTGCSGDNSAPTDADDGIGTVQAAAIPASWDDTGIAYFPSFGWDIACTFHPLNKMVNCLRPGDSLSFPTNDVAGYLDDNIGIQLSWTPHALTIVSNTAADQACIYVMTTGSNLYRACGNPTNNWPGPSGDFGHFTKICEPKDTSGNALVFNSNKMVTIRYFVPFGLSVSIGMVALATNGKVYGCDTATQRWAPKTTGAFSGLPAKTWTDISSGIGMEFFLKASDGTIWVRPRGTQDGQGNVSYPAPYQTLAVKDGSTTLTVASMAYPHVLTTNFKIYTHKKSDNTWVASSAGLPTNRTSISNIVDASQFFGQASIGVKDSSGHLQVRGM